MSVQGPSRANQISQRMPAASRHPDIGQRDAPAGGRNGGGVGRAGPSRTVIDLVDDSDDDDIQLLGHHRLPSRPRRREPERADYRNEPIVIGDSDDEVVELPPAAQPAARLHRRHLFSPPPPRQHAPFIPPVPQLPPPYRTHAAAPRRREDAWALDLFARRPPSPPPRAPAPARPSHHVPAMGLGGALIARANPPGRRHAPAPPLATREDAPRNTFIHRLDGPAAEGMGGVYRRYVGDIARLLRRGPFGFGGAFGGPLGAVFGGDGGAEPAPLGPREPDYEPRFTHPAPPVAGFSHDFAPPPPEPGAAGAPIVLDGAPVAGPAAALEPQIVCAACRTPLLGAGAGAVDADARVWALRCGHIFDGACVRTLMRPPPPLPPPPAEVPEDGYEEGVATPAASRTRPQHDINGKGKARATDPDSSEDELLLKAAPRARKGKGKRKAAPADDGAGDGDARADVKHESEPNTGMRSRLRPRPSAAALGASTAPAPPAPTARKTKALPRAGAKGKGKARAPEPAPRIVHEWTCPVSGCTRLHASVQIDGEWAMDPERGAVALFV